MPEITGTIQDERCNVYVGPFEFENIDSPCAAGTRVNGPAITSGVTESDGALPDGFSLAPGRTRLVVNGRKSKTFTVPEGNGTYDLANLMAVNIRVTQSIALAPTIAALREYKSDSTNFLGIVQSDSDGNGAFFAWDNDGTNADDGAQYIRPDDYDADEGGVWVRIAIG